MIKILFPTCVMIWIPSSEQFLIAVNIICEGILLIFFSVIIKKQLKINQFQRKVIKLMSNVSGRDISFLGEHRDHFSVASLNGTEIKKSALSLHM